jgi:type IV pilus assembly protein PilW
MLRVDMMNIIKSKGFSLVELLVAMVVGLIIISGAFSLHSTTRKTQMVNEMQMDMVADARFAIETISYDLRHAGMWGGTNKESFIRCKSTETIACTQSSASETLPSTVAGDCAASGVDVWTYDLSNPVFATDNSVGTNPYPACIPGTEGLVSSADVLEIRYADSNATLMAGLQAGQAYIRSNAINGRIFVGSTQPVIDAYDSNSLTNNHQLHALVYYISDHTDAPGDGIPSLRRAALVNGPAMQNQTLLSGVADLQVQFGEDADDDGDIDGYVNPDAVTDWSKIYSAKIWLVMRSDKKQTGADTSKTFFIAGISTDLGGVDDYRYFLVSSVVDLRNMKQL